MTNLTGIAPLRPKTAGDVGGELSYRWDQVHKAFYIFIKLCIFLPSILDYIMHISYGISLHGEP